MWYIHSALRKKDVRAHVITWAKLEDIMLSETSKSQMYFKVVKFINAESRMVVTQGLGGKGLGSYCLMDIVSVLQDREFCGLDGE